MLNIVQACTAQEAMRPRCDVGPLHMICLEQFGGDVFSNLHIGVYWLPLAKSRRWKVLFNINAKSTSSAGPQELAWPAIIEAILEKKTERLI